MNNSPTASFVDNAGHSIAVYEWGERGNPTIVLVHGYPDDHSVWQTVAAQLSKQFHVVAYDTRGSGDSDVPDNLEAYRLEHLAEDFGCVASALAPGKQVHLVGHDWGAIQSWEIATDPRLAGHLASFISMSGPCLDHVGSWTRDGLPSREKLLQMVSSWYIFAFQAPFLPELFWKLWVADRWPRILLKMGELVHEPEELTQFRLKNGVEGIKLYRANMSQRLLKPRERWVQVPTQVLILEKDRFVSPAVARTAARWGNEVSFKQLSHSHWSVFEDPSRLAHVITEFILNIS